MAPSVQPASSHGSNHPEPPCYGTATDRARTRMNTERSVQSIIGATDRRHGFGAWLNCTVAVIVAPHFGGTDEMTAWVGASRFVHGDQRLSSDDPAPWTPDAKPALVLANSADATDLLLKSATTGCPTAARRASASPSPCVPLISSAAPRSSATPSGAVGIQGLSLGENLRWTGCWRRPQTTPGPSLQKEPRCRHVCLVRPRHRCHRCPCRVWAGPVAVGRRPLTWAGKTARRSAG